MPKKIILESKLSPGDILMLTATVRDLKACHGNSYEIKVRTTAMELWENNPYLSDFPDDEGEVIECNYPLIHYSNQFAYHFIHGYTLELEKKLETRIPVTYFKGDLHMSKKEIRQKCKIGKPYWIINAGGKYDYTAKWWNPDYYQQVIDHFKDKITFVQIGSPEHFHPKLNGVIDMIGKTSIRQLIKLMYHAVGVLTPVTFSMHLAAAVPSPTLHYRPCIVLAGGREPVHWEAYPNHKFLHSIGQLSCCAGGGCWKSRCTKIEDNKETSYCSQPIYVRGGLEGEKFKKLEIPRCLMDIKPEEVIKEMEKYYNGGVLFY